MIKMRAYIDIKLSVVSIKEYKKCFNWFKIGRILLTINTKIQLL